MMDTLGALGGKTDNNFKQLKEETEGLKKT